MIEKKIAIMQPYFFPYIGYFQLIAAVDKFIIYDDVNFINRGWINRNNILINGKSGFINAPLNAASQNKLINEIDLVSEQKWRNTLLKTIEHSYKKAPQFDLVFPLIHQLINIDSVTISELNYKGIKAVCDYLSIVTTIIPSSEKYANSKLKGQYRILDICQQEKADHYINPTGGMELYNREVFSKGGIALSFMRSELPSYKQFKGEFTPALSIIDAMMFCDVDEIKHQLSKFGLE
jgi:hypothetical protein